MVGYPDGSNFCDNCDQIKTVSVTLIGRIQREEVLMKESRILRYWEAFQKVSGVTGEHYLAEQFGYGKQVGDESAELIRIGKKQPLLLLWKCTKK